MNSTSSTQHQSQDFKISEIFASSTSYANLNYFLIVFVLGCVLILIARWLDYIFQFVLALRCLKAYNHDLTTALFTFSPQLRASTSGNLIWYDSVVNWNYVLHVNKLSKNQESVPSGLVGHHERQTQPNTTKHGEATAQQTPAQQQKMRRKFVCNFSTLCEEVRKNGLCYLETRGAYVIIIKDNGVIVGDEAEVICADFIKRYQKEGMLQKCYAFYKFIIGQFISTTAAQNSNNCQHTDEGFIEWMWGWFTYKPTFVVNLETGECHPATVSYYSVPKSSSGDYPKFDRPTAESEINFIQIKFKSDFLYDTANCFEMSGITRNNCYISVLWKCGIGKKKIYFAIISTLGVSSYNNSIKDGITATNLIKVLKKLHLLYGYNFLVMMEKRSVGAATPPPHPSTIFMAPTTATPNTSTTITTATTTTTTITTPPTTTTTITTTTTSPPTTTTTNPSTPTRVHVSKVIVGMCTSSDRFIGLLLEATGQVSFYDLVGEETTIEQHGEVLSSALLYK